MTPTTQPQSSASLELKDHASFLRALARRLVRDASSADDLAQETLVAAISSKTQVRGLDSAEARPWMARVMRRKAANQWRSDSRRRDREDAAAKPEAIGSTFDSVAQIDLAERLLGHVRGLDRPMQEAIMGRFYRNMTLKDVAKEAGVPLTTAQSRVARGLTEIRAKLNAEEPGGSSAWLSAMAAFGGAGGGTGVASIAAAAAVGRTSAWWIAAAVAGTAALVGAAVLWIDPAGAGSDRPATEPATQLVTTGGSESIAPPQPARSPSEGARLVEVSSTEDPSVARLEIAAPSAEARPGATGQSEAAVYFLDGEGIPRPAANTRVEWSVTEAVSPRGSLSEPALRGLGYGGDSSAVASAETPSAITNAGGGFEIDTVPSDDQLQVKVPGDETFREAKWSGTGAEWKDAEEQIRLTRIPHGALSCRLVDYAGMPLAEVEVSVSDGAAKEPRELITDSEGALVLPHFANPRHASLAQALQLPGYTVVGSEQPKALETGGWHPLTLVMAKTGTIRLTLPKSKIETREFAVFVSPADPMQIRPKFREMELNAVVQPDGVAIFQNVPIGPALHVLSAKSLNVYDYQLHGVAYASNSLVDADVPTSWSRIRVPESSTLELALPDETTATLNVSVIREDGTPAGGATVMGYGRRAERDAREKPLFYEMADANGKLQVVVPALDSSQRWTIGAIDTAALNGSQRGRGPRTEMILLDPRADLGEEIVLRPRPIQITKGRVVLPGASGDYDLSKTTVLVTTLAPYGAGDARLPLRRRGVTSRVDAEGRFGFRTRPECHYRIEAQHEGFGDVQLDIDHELDADSPLVEVRFQPPTDLAQVAVGDGSTDIVLPLRPEVVAAGSLVGFESGPQEVFLQLIPEGRSDPLALEGGGLGRRTSLILIDPHGRFRCECPIGSYTAWIGTRAELKAKRPRRRVPITITAEGLTPAKL